MFKLGTAVAAVVAISAGASALAGPFEDGLQAIAAGDYEAAIDIALPAAGTGDANSQELMGIIYAMGLGVEQNYATAFDWYLQASMQGHAGAQSGLGWYYEVGLGVPIDLVQGHMWYALSAAGGDPDAALSLPEIEKKMTAEEITAAQIAAREMSANW